MGSFAFFARRDSPVGKVVSEQRFEANTLAASKAFEFGNGRLVEPERFEIGDDIGSRVICHRMIVSEKGLKKRLNGWLSFEGLQACWGCMEGSAEERELSALRGLPRLRNGQSGCVLPLGDAAARPFE
jgi:hypothetical protein